MTMLMSTMPMSLGLFFNPPVWIHLMPILLSHTIYYNLTRVSLFIIANNITTGMRERNIFRHLATVLLMKNNTSSSIT
jgi:hypothetical protein